MDSPESEKIYLDYNATTPLAPEVVTSITGALTNAWANPSSSSELGKRAKQMINEARTSVATMLGAAQDTDIVFTSGGTEANNQVLWSALEYFKAWQKENNISESEKPHIITTNVEHDAILLPLKHFEAKKWADVDFVPVCQKTGQVLPEVLLKYVERNTCLVSVMLANNETGVIMPVSEIARRLKELNQERKRELLCHVYLHTDAAQAVGKIPVNVKDLGVDYLTIVGHKFYGPRNGALYVRDLGDNEKSAPLYPLIFGGGQERSYRPGTENTPMICGLGRSAELVSTNLQSYHNHMRQMRDLLQALLIKEFGERVFFNCGESERLPNTCNASFKETNLTGGDILSRCPALMASTGAACHGTGKPSAILMASGVSLEDARTAVRLSVGRSTTPTEIGRVVQMLVTAVKILQ